MPDGKLISGMQGVFLVAAEPAKRKLIVAPTSRSAFGADLLATDQTHKRAWSVEVKTNAGNASFWLVGKHAFEMKSDSYVYVLENLRQAKRRQTEPQFYVVPSEVVASHIHTNPSKTNPDTAFHQINRCNVEKFKDNWALFTASMSAAA